MATQLIGCLQRTWAPSLPRSIDSGRNVRPKKHLQPTKARTTLRVQEDQEDSPGQAAPDKKDPQQGQTAADKKDPQQGPETADKKDSLADPAAAAKQDSRQDPAVADKKDSAQAPAAADKKDSASPTAADKNPQAPQSQTRRIPSKHRQ